MVDFLKECMSDVSSKLGKVVPINEFNQAFCVLCVNRDCSRSRSNNLLIARRSANWRENLFINVPRAGDNDPQYANIRSKNFVSVNPSISVPISNNILQNTSEESTRNPIEQKLNIEFKSEDTSKLEPVLPIEPEPEPEPKSPPPPPPIQPKPIKLPAGNTPFAQGTVLSSKKPEVFLEPGQSYTFGSDDETNKT